MPHSPYRAEYESALARAWNALQKAREAADLMNDFGATEDIWQIAEEIRRLQEASLKDARRLKAR